MVFLPNSHSVPFAVCCEGCQGIALFGIGTIYIYIYSLSRNSSLQRSQRTVRPTISISGKPYYGLPHTMVWKRFFYLRGYATGPGQCDGTNLSLFLTDGHTLRTFFFSKKSFSTLKTFKKLHTKNLLACRVLIVRSFRCTRF